jgi:hypothetical protein
MNNEEMQAEPTGSHYLRLFPTGTLLNPLPPSVLGEIRGKEPISSHAVAKVPARANTLVARLDRIISPAKPGVFSVGSLNFALSCYTKAQVDLREDGQVVIADAVDPRTEIVRHAGLVMKDTLGTGKGFTISATNLHDIIHGGLGSSSALFVATAAAINHAYGDIIPRASFLKLLAQNYGEESGQRDMLVGIPCIGGIAAVSLYGGGLVALLNEAEVVGRIPLPEDSSICVLRREVPQITALSEADAHLGEGALLQFAETQSEWGRTYGRILEESVYPKQVVPAMAAGNLQTIADIIFAFTLGGFGNMAEVYALKWQRELPGFATDISDLRELKGNKDIITAFVSSIGPSLAIVTYNPRIVEEYAERHRFDYLSVLRPDNTGITFAT